MIYGPAEYRANAEHTKEIRSDPRSTGAERRITQRSIQPTSGKHCHVGKRVTLFLPGEKIAVYRPPRFQWSVGNARYRFVQERELLRLE